MMLMFAGACTLRSSTASRHLPGRKLEEHNLHPRGYGEEVECGLRVDGEPTLQARCGDEEIQLSDEQLADRAERVEDPAQPGWTASLAGCHGLSLPVKYLRSARYRTIMQLPICHAFWLGLVKDLWVLVIDGPQNKHAKDNGWYRLSAAAKSTLKQRAKALTLTCDQGRPYRCIVADRGYWVMENWSFWTEFASVALLQDFMTGVGAVVHTVEN
jgi:hypothetical protein